tara:strand:+ start:3971 stop:4189 length:219 start_codon:yes stop_codon:yes gene_type:complete
MKKILISTTLLLTIIAGSTSSYAGSCSPNIYGGFNCSGGISTTPNIYGGFNLNNNGKITSFTPNIYGGYNWN